MMLAPVNPHGKRLRKRYGKVRNSLFTFLEHPEAPPDNTEVSGSCNPQRRIAQGSRISNLLDLRFPLARLEADRLYAMA